MRWLLVVGFVLAAPALDAKPKTRTERAREAVVLRAELPQAQRKHTPWHYPRAAARCVKRATEFARTRCLERVASE